MLDYVYLKVCERSDDKHTVHVEDLVIVDRWVELLYLFLFLNIRRFIYHIWWGD